MKITNYKLSRCAESALGGKIIFMALRGHAGQLSISLLIFSAITVIMVGGFALSAGSFLTLSLRDFNKTSAFSIAEAGVEYYRWHLAHAALDFWDGHGATSTGPYVHTYYDKQGTAIGTFSLDITPPPTGSTIVTIKSTGKVFGDTSVTKSIQVKLGIPSLAKYSAVANDNMRFGAGTEVYGELMSNKGIRFDAVAHNVVKSALPSYTDPDSPYDNAFGVHTHTAPADPSPPAAVPNRPTVFMAGRQFPIPLVSFAGLSQNLSSLRAQATSSGFYATSSGSYGFELVFGASSTYQVYKVTALESPPRRCTNTNNQDGWGTWSVRTRTAFKNGTIPENGIFFFEDNLWVRGQINNSRVTVVSGRLTGIASTYTSITVNSDLLYTNYDGKDSIGLIAEKHINIGMMSEDDLRIDGALVAQNGRVGRYYYESDCSPYNNRQTITSYGMIATNVRYGFAYTDGSGYATRNLIYDANFLYGPPPSFPLSASNYVQVSWEEIQ
jgi:hypothetical protein